jgi:Cu/Ag efflux pump CusA
VRGISASQNVAVVGRPDRLPGSQANVIRELFATREVTMRLIVVCVAAIFLAVGGNAFVRAASGPDVSYYMVIIATSISGSAADVQMATLTFPSERACMAVAAIFGQSTAGANVVARCAPQK